MPKQKNSVKLQKNEIAILLLLIAILGVSLVLYNQYKTQNKLNNAYWTDIKAHQIEINKLQNCLNENTRPCEITPSVHELN